MKKFIFFVVILNLLIGCQSVQNPFSLKKKDNTDEFLIEKKNPLVMPPDFNDLPEPGLENKKISDNKIEDVSFESTLKSEVLSNNTQNEINGLSIEDQILKNINKNEVN